MKSINEIDGYIYGFDKRRWFKGKLLLDGDGWVEGIINLSNNDLNNGKRFVFGNFYPEKLLELFELSLTNNNETLNFHAEKCPKDYTGKVLCINGSNQEQYGLCSIIMKEQKLDPKSVSCEIEELESEIEEFKKRMDLYGRTFYNETIQNKDRIIKAVTDSCDGNADIKRLLK